MMTAVDLVMPKLGLTMSEGKVARWAVTPGTAFAAGDTVVVVETDKIAFDVEASSAGTLSDILVQDGDTVAVGTPIARWIPSDRSPEERWHMAPVPGSAAPLTAGPAEPWITTPRTTGRIIATPYARRIAREEGLDLATVTATKARITAADVRVAIARRGEISNHEVRSPSAPSPAFCIYGMDVSVDRVLRLIADIDASAPELRPSVTHFVALATARALGEGNIPIALAHSDGPARVLTADATRHLSSVVAADRGNAEVATGRVTLTIADMENVTLVCRAPESDGATLGVGAVTRLFRPDGAGQPALRAEVNITLSVGGATSLPNPSALLSSIRTLLENPLAILAT